MKQFYFAVGLLVALAWTGNVLAAPVLDGGISTIWSGGIEATQTLDTASLHSGTFGPDQVYSSLLQGGFANAGLNQATAIGTVAFPGYGPNVGPAFGDSGEPAQALRGLIRMNLAGGLIKDVAGPDLYVTESGSVGGPEGYMLRVSTNGGATFTSWQYRQAQVQYDPDGNDNCDFFTGFDLTSTFGLPAGSTVSDVEIQNVNLTDRVTSAAGLGRVVFSGEAGYDSAFTLTAGPLSSAGNVAYATSKFDADPTYIFYQSSVALLPGDANRDGTTDATDLNTVLSFYNQEGKGWAGGDFNNDGMTDATDLNSVLSYYNQTSSLQMGAVSTSSVPEPSSIVMLATLSALAGAWAIRRRSR